MSGKDCMDSQELPKPFDDTWEEEIKRLKHDIKKTENRIIMTEKRRKLFDRQQFEIDLPTTDTEPIDSENKYPEPYCLENVERVIPGRQLVPGGSKAFRAADKPATPPKGVKKESDAEPNAGHGFWVSPSSIMRKRPKEYPSAEWVRSDPSAQELPSESPKRVRSSPPGKSERSQNREWLSPHRVIDRPSPEDSHGNWVSMREIHRRVVHSPPESDLNANEIREMGDEPNRPFSQSTYTIRRNLFTPDTLKSEDFPVTRKTTVLNDFEAEVRDAAPKRRAENPLAQCRTITTSENTRRIVHPDGHIVKVSTLGEISVGIAHSKHEDNAEAENKIADAAEAKNPRGTTLKKIVMKDMKGPITHSSPRKCRGTRKPGESKKPSIRPKEEPQNDKENKPKSEDRQNEEGDDVMADLKKIFDDQKNENEFCPKRKSFCDTKRSIRQEENAKRAKTSSEEKNQEVENRRKGVDVSAVQKYIKLQRMKRVEQLKSERERKAAEKEARKKKLEGLRIRTLQLAGSSKKKISETGQISSIIKIIEPEAETEEDMTISLGLKQTKPKVSYNESILNLKKKANRPEQKKCDNSVRAPEPDAHAETDHENGELINVSPPNAFAPAKTEHPKVDIEKNTNLALKKLAETLQLTLQQQKKAQAVGDAAAALNKTSDAEVSNGEEPLAKQDNQKVITVDMETIKSLKHDIKKISEDFQILHEIIIDKSASLNPARESLPEAIPSGKMERCSSNSRSKAKQKVFGHTEEAFPLWLRHMRPHPYNVLTAVRNKMKLNHRVVASDKEADDDATYGGGSVENRYESDSDTLPTTTNQMSSTNETDLISSSETKTDQTTSEVKYYSFRYDSGSELSSSILDSERHKNLSRLEILKKPSDCLKLDSTVKGTLQSLAVEDITAINRDGTNTDSKKLKDNKENLVLIPPSVQLVSSTQAKPSEIGSLLKSPTHSLSLNAKCCSSTVSEDKSENVENNNNEETSEVEEIITESIRSSSLKVDSTVARFNEVCVTRSFFNPEALHVQFQAELTLLETFQRSLSHFLEMERRKALSHAEKSKSNRAVNTENVVAQEGLSARESCAEASSHDEETELSVKTELEIAKIGDDSEESAKTDTDENGGRSAMTEAESEKKSSGGGEKSAADSTASKKKSLDSSDSTTGISLQMLNRMVKDEELRSEHQLALIRLREKTLSEKVKAELTFLEIRKKALKEKGSEEEQAISAIKKKQRGILLKYQSEKEDIERLKKMHKIASEERKIMIKQQKQIQKMQLSTKDMLIKLKKREKSPQKRIPIKLKAFKYYDSQSDIQEDISINASDNLTDSVTSLDESINRSIESDMDVTSKNNASDGGDEILKRNMKMLKERISMGVEKSTKMGGNSESRKHLKRGHSADELLKWTKRLEEKENWLKEMENQIGSLFHVSKHKAAKSFKEGKISVRDRSTSPFQFQEIVKSICETSPSLTEAIEVKNSSSIAELIEGSSKTEDAEEMNGKAEDLAPEKHPTSASEDIQEEFSKKTNAASRSVEYNSESFESPSSSDTHKSKPVAVKSKSSERNSLGNGITIKMALSPRVRDTRRRYSSGSDESLNLFQAETASEQSDVEIRIAALHEQLRCRKLEAERLRREQKRAHRERLKAKEQSLIKQIEAYDSYIQKKKQELQQEYERKSPTLVKPIVRQTKMSDKVSLKRADASGSGEDEWKTSIQTKFALKKKELDVTPGDKSASGNDKESDSEIVENIKLAKDEEDESVKEEIARKDAASGVASDSVPVSKKNVSDSTASSMLESLPVQSATIEGTYSESEDQTETNVSVKTTLLSPEKPDIEMSETTTKADTVESEELYSEEKDEASAKEETEVAEEMKYSSESFESDKSAAKKTDDSAGVAVSEESKTVISESINATDGARSKKDEGIEDEVSRDRSEGGAEEEEIGDFEAETETGEEVPLEEENECGRKAEVASEASITSEGCEKTDADADQLAEVDEAVQISQRMTDLIAESILGDLMSESLKVIIGKARRTRKAKECPSFVDRALRDKVDVMTNSLAAEMISEAIDDALRRYDRKKRYGNGDGGGRTSSVRRRVIEIMSQTPTVKREHQRPQDLMVTTYDLPAGVTAAQEFASSEREEFLQSLSPTKDKSVKIELSNVADIPVQQPESDAYGQEWFDEDFGLSRTRREAEELRLQQLQIEQEIQQLQAQQEQVPYYYLRQIPNKPPPPYTPPGAATAERFTSEAEITSVASMAVRVLSDELDAGREFSEIEAPATFFAASDNDHVKCYKVFLFDLAKHILSEAIGVGSAEEEKLPWMRTSESLSKYKMKRIERTFECLLEVVMKQILVLFGFRQKMGKERLIVRWSRKKRDHLDEILVGESQEEESEWTQYDEDEVTVKNNVATGILDSLLDETVQILGAIWLKKRRKTD